MSRTEWPLLNRARVNGILPPGATIGEAEPQPLKLQEWGIQPINTTVAFASEPGPEKLNGPPFFASTEIKPPFQRCWNEWQEPNGLDNGETAYCCAYTGQQGDAVQLLLSYCAESHLLPMRTMPVMFLGVVNIDLRWFKHGARDVPELLQVAMPLRTESADKALSSDLVGCACSVLFSWLLAASPNTQIEETQPTTRCRKRFKKPDRVVHRELCIRPGRRRTGEPRNGSTQGVALHVRRGHFADYTQGKGLFGKHKIRVWVPGMAVGNPDYGTVLKSYRIGEIQ